MIYIRGDTYSDFTRFTEEEKISEYRKKRAYFRIRDFS